MLARRYLWSINLLSGYHAFSMCYCTYSKRRDRRSHIKGRGRDGVFARSAFDSLERGIQITGDEKDGLFPEEAVDNLEALEDYINREGTQGHGRFLQQKAEQMVQRYALKQESNLKQKILERKYFKKPQEVNLLTWKAKEQIRYLHNEFPDEWTPERLAESFPVSVNGVQQIIASSYSPRSQEEIEKHDKRVAAHWNELKQTLAIEGGPVNSQMKNFQHVIGATNRLHLMINAGGASTLPMLRNFEKDRSLKRKQHMGVFESIVTESQLVKDMDTKTQKNDDQKINSTKLLREIADSGRRNRKSAPSSTFYFPESYS